MSPMELAPTFPSLKYDIVSKKRSITTTVIIIVLIIGLIPAAVYYILQDGTSASRNTVISIVQISPVLSTLKWPWRLYLLLRRNGERAPRNSTSFTWDFSQWCFLFAILFVAVFMVFAAIYTSMRWYMFGFVALFGVVAVLFLLTWVLAYREVSMPIRMSSLLPGTTARPILYTLIEDFTACDGGAGRTYRERLNIRWQSSPLFRELLMNLTLLPAIGVLVQTVFQIVILFVTPEVVYVALSAGLLWGWFMLTLWFGWLYAAKGLRAEKMAWDNASSEFLSLLQT